MQFVAGRFRLNPSSLKSLLINPGTLAAASIAVVLAIYALSPLFLQLIELNWFDLRFRMRGPVATPHPGVVLAAIDEASLDAEGRWPWPRAKIAQLIDALAKDGAAAIGFDVTFTEPADKTRTAMINDLNRELEALDIRDPRLTQYIRDSWVESDNDLILMRSLQRSTTPVVLGYFFHITEESLGYALPPREVDRRLRGIAKSKYPMVLYKDPDATGLPFIKAYAPEINLDIFNEAAPSTGYFSVAADPDGVVRWMPMMIQGGEDFYPPISVLLLWEALGRPQLAPHVGEYGVEGIEIGDFYVPTDEYGRLLINYLGPGKTFPHYSVTDIIDGSLPPGTFKNKIVLVGATAMGIGDIRSTPFAPVYPGPEIHATVIDNILTGDHLARPRWTRLLDVAAIVGLGFLVWLALRRLSAVGGLVATVGLFLVFGTTAYLLFAKAGIWLNVVYPITALSLTYTTLTVYRYLTEELERKRVKNTFQRYVSSEVIESVLKQPDELRLGGQEKVLTVLFSDLAGFTSFSERHTPSEVTAILSDYYDVMTEQLFAHQGTLIGYVGDELIGLFGAPMEQADQAQRACVAALAMRHHRNLLGEQWLKIGRPQLKARTGINTGPMLVGNIGSKYRFHYSVLGDNVNLASRLEQLGKPYGVEIIIGESTADMAGKDFVLRQLDLVQVKGRSTPLRIYELLGSSEFPVPPERERILGDYAAGFEAYRHKRWDEALGLFGHCLELSPGDTASQVMAERCRIYRETPPPEEWDGVFTHLTKG